MRLTVISPTADILGDPANAKIISEKDSQLIYGEQFEVEKERGAYVYGYSLHDNYYGYVEREQLTQAGKDRTHIVTVRSTHLYPEPSFKSRPLFSLSFLSKMSIADEPPQNGFVKTGTGAFIFAGHLEKITDFKSEQDLADTARLYLGTPYYYGGRSSRGIDCTGLVQQVMVACGKDCPPRDSSDQQGSFGQEIKREDIQKNDVVYFKGHVGIMVDNNHIINATARHMTTLIEPLDELEKAYGGITHIARI